MPTLLSNLMTVEPDSYGSDTDKLLWIEVKNYFTDNNKMVSKATEIPFLLDEAFLEVTGQHLKNPFPPASDNVNTFWSENVTKLLMTRYYLAVFS